MSLSPPFISRKQIWENYPVSLIPLGKDNDGAERHAVVWKRKNLVEWRQTCPDTNAWHMYESAVAAVLLNELRRSTKWVVEPQQKEDEICIIRMAFKSAPNNVVSRKAWPPSNIVPTLTRLADIKAFFPMAIWREQTNASANQAKKSYTIELSCKKLKGLNETTVQEIKQNLLRSLKATTAWTVTLSNCPDELCTIVMN